MATISTRDGFKEYCLRKLGKPVIEINVDEDQVEDRVSEAIQYYWDYHFDGAEKIYYKAQITPTDIANRYITVPDNIIGVINMFPVGQALSTNNLFNIRYQIALNDLYTLTSVSMTPYYMAMQHVQFLEQMLIGQQPLRYNRIINKCYVDMDWTIINAGDYLIFEAYQVVDPEQYTKGYNERWLQNYATVLIKEQWGSNLKKFEGMQMPGGLKFNGQKIYDEARAERAEMEKEMIYTFSMPVIDMIG
jgi:hypothetical protein